MLSSPSPLYFQTELSVPPVAMFRIEKSCVRSLFNKMFEADGYPYDALNLQGNTPSMSSKREDEEVSSCRFTDYSICIEEKNPRFSADDFVGIVRKVLSGFGPFRPVYMQRVRIQCLCQSLHSVSAVHLLANKVANVMDRISPFERPPAYFGVRFRFPPLIAVDHEDAETDNPMIGQAEVQEEEHKGFITLRFETYDKDLKQVWMEVAAMYPFPEPVSLPEHLDAITRNVTDTYHFLAEKGKKFLDQFDVQGIDDGGNQS